MKTTSLTPETLQDLIAQGEGERLAFKRSLAEAGQPEPVLRDTGGSFIITLYGLDMEKALAEGEAEAIDLVALGLNQRQQQAIEYILKHGRITNREYRALGNVSHEMAHRDYA